MTVYLLLTITVALVILFGYSFFGLKTKLLQVIFSQIFFVNLVLLISKNTSNLENRMLLLLFFPLFMGFFVNSVRSRYLKFRELIQLRKTVVFLEFILAHMSLGKSFVSGVQHFAGEILELCDEDGRNYDVILQQLKSSPYFRLKQLGYELEEIRSTYLRRVDLIEFLIWRREFLIEHLELRSIALYQYFVQSSLISFLWVLGLGSIVISGRFEENIKIVVISGCLLVFGSILSRFIESSEDRTNLFL